MKKFVVSVVPLLLILSMLLTACGASGGASQEPTPATTTGTGAEPTTALEPTTVAEPTTAAEPTSADQPTEAATGEATAAATEMAGGGQAMTLPDDCGTVTLEYWNPFTGPDGPFMGQIVDDFNSANPNIQVNMTTQAEYMTQLQTAAASGALPDVLIINEDQIGTSAFRNIIRPIDELVERIGISGDDYPEVAWNAGEVAGKRYAIPLSFVAMTMYYNEDLMKAAGIDAPPTNREEFEAAAAAMTTDGQKGFNITGGFPVQQIFQMLLHQFGGTEFNEDTTEATWNSDAGVQALTWMKEAQSKWSEPNLEVDAELNAFKAGTTGMVWNGSWQVPNLTGDAVEFSGMATSVPQIGPEPAVWAGGPLLALPAKSDVNECTETAAGMFIKYVVDHSVEWAEAGNVPASNTARNSSEFQSQPLAVIAPSLDNPVFPPPVPGISDAFAPLGEAVGSVMNGTATDIKGALDDAADRANQILAENKATYGEAPPNQ